MFRVDTLILVEDQREGWKEMILLIFASVLLSSVLQRNQGFGVKKFLKEQEIATS